MSFARRRQRRSSDPKRNIWTVSSVPWLTPHASPLVTDLLQCTHEPNVSIPSLANLLIERSSGSGNWIVVFKSLVTVHHLMCYGNERFTQFLATTSSSATIFQHLTSFTDKSSSLAIEMSTFIRRYAKFLNAKASSYRSLGADFARIRSESASSATGLRHMSGEKILKTLPVLQQLLDSLLEFDAHPRDLNNGVVTSAFLLLYRDLIRLFACFNDGIICLLEKFFSFRSKRDAREALDLYKRFLIRMDRVAEFLKTAEAVGIDKGDIPDLTRAPSSLLDALESHLAAMDSSSGSSQTVTKQPPLRSGTATVAVPSSDVLSAALAEEAQYLSQIEERQRKQRQHQTPLSQNNNSQSLLPDFNPFEDDQEAGAAAAAGLLDLESTGRSDDGRKSHIMTQEILSLFESNSASMSRHSATHSLPPAAMFQPVAGSWFPAPGAGMGWPAQHQQQLTSGSNGSSSSNPFVSGPPVGSFPFSGPAPIAGGDGFQANFASAFPSSFSSPASGATLVPSLQPTLVHTGHNQAPSLKSVTSAKESSASSSLNSLPGVRELFPDSFPSSKTTTDQRPSMATSRSTSGHPFPSSSPSSLI